MIWKRLSLRFGSITMGQYFCEKWLSVRFLKTQWFSEQNVEKTTESQIWFNYYGTIFLRKMTECQISQDIVVFRAKCWKNDRVSDLVQLLWVNIFSKNDRVSDFSRHSRFQSKMLNKRLSSLYPKKFGHNPSLHHGEGCAGPQAI